jgi:fibronectin type 3 domain-containing protein
MPLTAPPFTEPVTFGVESCYELRSVEGDGPAAVEGDASTAVCVTPVDRFPPAAPVQLVAVATEGAINLLWEANTESDLSGYIVLRGAVGDARLQSLTPMPISDVRYTDTTVVSGMRYVYAVVAVDRQSPTPNMSPESARVEETAQ